MVTPPYMQKVLILALSLYFLPIIFKPTMDSCLKTEMNQLFNWSQSPLILLVDVTHFLCSDSSEQRHAGMV